MIWRGKNRKSPTFEWLFSVVRCISWSVDGKRENEKKEQINMEIKVNDIKLYMKMQATYERVSFYLSFSSISITTPSAAGRRLPSHCWSIKPNSEVFGSVFFPHLFGSRCHNWVVVRLKHKRMVSITTHCVLCVYVENEDGWKRRDFMLRHVD